MSNEKEFPVKELITEEEKQNAKSLATCGNCGRSWDDAVVTSMTPAPSARCPFEYFHADTPEYEVENGIIKSPGKFEGEMHYVPQLWDMCLAGEYDDKLPNGDYVLLVDDELRSIAPEIDVDTYAIVLWESEHGFIYADECKLEELKEYCEQWANKCDDD